jgi:hypothetical protein
MINISMRKIHFAHPKTSDTASTYVGDVNELWVDDTNSYIIRRGDGSTAGGIIIGGHNTELKVGTAAAPTSSNVAWDFATYKMLNVDFNADIDLTVSNAYLDCFDSLWFNRDSSTHTVSIYSNLHPGTLLATITIPGNALRTVEAKCFSTNTVIILGTPA